MEKSLAVTIIYLDGNVWDFLYVRKIDLGIELPREEFDIFITREAEFEIAAMPNEKRVFAEGTISRCGIRTDVLFGFHNETLSDDEQRIAGFDIGRWPQQAELDF